MFFGKVNLILWCESDVQMKPLFPRNFCFSGIKDIVVILHVLFLGIFKGIAFLI